MKFTIEQKSKINTQGPALHVNILKKFHQKLRDKKLLGKDLNITIVFDDDVDVS